jgi:DNA-binding transcriptional regulator YhcF (GntR family)
MAQEYPFVVNAGSVVAVYTQIESQVRFGIASGALPYQATKRR